MLFNGLYKFFQGFRKASVPGEQTKECRSVDDTANGKVWPSAKLFPVAIPLKEYRFRHGTTASSEEDAVLLGRTSLIQQLFTWLKQNHVRAGTGRRHGCYLVTGYRGVGKTSYVNRVLFHYENWLRWLYGDGSVHTDELRINLGAGDMTPLITLQVLAERLYTSTRSSFWSRLFKANFRWMIVLCALILATIIALGAVSLVTRMPLAQTTWTFGTASGGSLNIKRYSARNMPAPDSPFQTPSLSGILSNNFQSSEIDIRPIFEKWQKRIIRCIPGGVKRVMVGSGVKRVMVDSGVKRVMVGICNDWWPRYTSTQTSLHSFQLTVLKDCLDSKSCITPSRSAIIRRILIPLPLALFGAVTLVYLFLKIGGGERHRDQPPPWKGVVGDSPNNRSPPISSGPLFSRVLFPGMAIVLIQNLGFMSAWIALILTVFALFIVLYIFRSSIRGRVLPEVPTEYYKLAIFGLAVTTLLRTPWVYDWLTTCVAIGAAAVISILGFFNVQSNITDATPTGSFGIARNNRQMWTRILLFVGVVFLTALLLMRTSLAWPLILFLLFAALAFMFDCVNRWGMTRFFSRESTTVFADALAPVKLVVVLLIILIYAILLQPLIQPEWLTFRAIGFVQLFCLSLIRWAIVWMPCVTVLAMYDYFLRNNRRVEEDVDRVGSPRREKCDFRRRDSVLRETGSMPLPHCLAMQWFHELAYQRFLARIHRRLRATAESEVGTSGPLQSFIPFRRTSRELAYTYETLEADLIEAIRGYNRAFPDRDLVVVFDELDRIRRDRSATDHGGTKSDPNDLDKGDDGQIEGAQKLLAQLKNILLSAEARFIFVAGVDLHDHWLADISEFVHMTSSLFSHPIMVPTLLTDPTDYMESDATSLIGTLIARSIVPRKGFMDIDADVRERLRSDSIGEVIPYVNTLGQHGDRQLDGSGDITLDEVREHIATYPTVNTVATYLAREFRGMKDGAQAVAYRCHAKGGLLEEVPFYQVFSFIDMVNYLTFRSIGIPRLVFLYYDRYIIEREIRNQLYLEINADNLHPVQLLSYLYQMFHVDMSEAIKEHGDKLVFASLYFVGYLCRHHARAFDRTSIESMREVLSPRQSPQVRDILGRLMEMFERVCLIPIRNGVYDYRFTDHLRTEMRYASLVDETVRSVFNFALEQNEEIRKQYRREADDSLKIAMAESKMSLRKEDLPHYAGCLSGHYRIGQLHEAEGQYEKALFSYRRSIEEYRAIYDHTAARGGRGEKVEIDGQDMTNMVLVVRSALRIGLVYEKMSNYPSAWSYYLLARNYAECLFSVWGFSVDSCEAAELLGKGNPSQGEKSKDDKDGSMRDPRHLLDVILPQLVASPMLLQAYFAAAHLSMKLEQTAEDSDRFHSIRLVFRHLLVIRKYVADEIIKTQILPKGRHEAERRTLLNAKRTLQYYISLCHAREGDLEYFGGGLEAFEHAARWYANALRAQLGLKVEAEVEDDPDVRVSAVKTDEKERGVDEWSLHQKEGLACALSHLGDALFVCGKRNSGGAGNISFYDETLLLRAAALRAQSVEESSLTPGGGDLNTLVRDLPFLRNAAFCKGDESHLESNPYELWILSSQMFGDAGEYLRAGLQMNKALQAMQKVLARVKEEPIRFEDKTAWERAAEMFCRLAQRWYRVAYDHAYKWASNKDVGLIRRIAKDLGWSEPVVGEHMWYRFMPNELRECEVISAHISLRLLELSDRDVAKDELPALTDSVCKMARFFGYRAFPVRVRLRFLELYGDFLHFALREQLMPGGLPFALFSPKQDLRAQPAGGIDDQFHSLRKPVVEAWVEAARAYDTAIDIRSTLGTSFSLTNVSLAILHEKLATVTYRLGDHIRRVFSANSQNLTRKEIDEKVDRFWQALRNWGRHPDFPLSRSEVTVADPVYQFNLARDAYVRSVAAHQLGKVHADICNRYCYLTDDFHSEDVHFSVAYEVFMMDHSKERVEAIDKSLKQHQRGNDFVLP